MNPDAGFQNNLPPFHHSAPGETVRTGLLYDSLIPSFIHKFNEGSQAFLRIFNVAGPKHSDDEREDPFVAGTGLRWP